MAITRLLASALLVTSLSLLVCLTGATQRHSEPGRDGITPSLAPTKKSFKAGEPIALRVTIQNNGPRALYLPRTLGLYSWVSNIDFVVLDEGRRMILNKRYAIDPVPNKIDLSTLLRDYYVLLPSNYSYGTTLDLQSYLQDPLSKPGRYHVHAVYNSFGLNAASYFSKLHVSRLDLSKLESEIWEGAVESHVVYIDLVRRGR